MKNSGAGAVVVLALVMITGLSVMYWKDVGERLVTAGSSVNGTEFPICSVKTESPEISLTFNTAGGEANVQKILEILERQQVKATFFVSGEWVEKYPKEVQKILDAGHDLGNSGETHRQMTELSAEECKKEIMQLHEKVKDLTGYEMNLWRPPYGEYNDRVLKIAYGCGYYPVCWNVDSLDWKNYGAEDIVKRVTENKNLENGAIVLCRTNSKHICEALEELLHILKGKGYTPVPVSGLIGADE